jgi:methionyl-tRNA formyltransferase
MLAPLHASRLERTLNAHRILSCELGDVNEPRFLERLRRLAPDLVLNYSLQRYGPELLKIPRMGCINLHPALLPAYRGVYPTFWELYNGERESGVSIHFMNERLDAGPIIATKRFHVSPGETVRSMDRKKLEALPGLLTEALDALAEDRVILQENNPNSGGYYSVPSREALVAFRKERGGRWY